MNRKLTGATRPLAVVLAVLFAAACNDAQPTAPSLSQDDMTPFTSTADVSSALTGDPKADGWTFSGNSMANGIYVRGNLNASYDIYTTTFEVTDPAAFAISNHAVDAESFYHNYYAGVPSSNLWDPSEVARAWETGHTVVVVGGKFTDIDADKAGWEDGFTGNEVNEALDGSQRHQAKFGTGAATWAASTVAPDQGNGSGSTADGGNATFLVRTTNWPNLSGVEAQPIGAKHSGEIMGLQQTDHITAWDGKRPGPDVARLIWIWDEDDGRIVSWQILLNTTLVAQDLEAAGATGFELTGAGDPIVTTVQRGSGPVTDGLVRVAVPEVANDPAARENCRDGGWEAFGFANQGLCIQFVNTGKDSR